MPMSRVTVRFRQLHQLVPETKAELTRKGDDEFAEDSSAHEVWQRSPPRQDLILRSSDARLERGCLDADGAEMSEHAAPVPLR